MFRRAALPVVATLLLAACQPREIVRPDEQRAHAIAEVTTPTVDPLAAAAPTATITVVDTPYVPLAVAHDWLRDIRVGDLRVTEPVAGDAILRMLRAEGMTITTSLPVAGYTYAGMGVHGVDGETALRVLLGGMGLDYQVDDIRHVVTVVPLPARTWTLNLGNRSSSWVASGAVAATSSGSGSGSSSSGSSTSTASSSSGTAAGGSSGGAGNSITAQDDVWSSFREELETRLTRLAPCASAPVVPPAGGAADGLGLPPGVTAPLPPQATGAGAGCLFEEQQFGRFSVNPETGAVWVQAPRWMLDELDDYFTEVQRQYNTMITFEGRVILLSEERGDSAGIDLQAVASWAGGRYGLAVVNNALGGVTLHVADGETPTVEGALPSTTAGFRYQDGQSALQLFSGFLAKSGNVSVLQRPLVATTSGVPGQFNKSLTTYYLNVNQTTSGGSDGSSSVGTQNELVPVELGTSLRLNPRWDPATGLVRAQIELDQRVQSGTLTIDQHLSGDGDTTVSTEIPLVSRQQVTGEVLLRDGDLIILGGQSETEDRADASGLPGFEQGPLSWLAGQKSATGRRSTYFFALQVKVDRKKTPGGNG